MLCLSPLPDELNISYFGRLIEINGLPKEDLKSLKILKEMVPLDPHFGHKVPFRLQISAFAAGMSIPQFVQNHTLYPYRRAIGNGFGTEDPRRPLTNYYSNHFAKPRLGTTRAIRDEAYFCMECVSENTKEGMSYWHRTHQLHGIFVCPSHGRPLRLIESHDAFSLAPSHCLPVARDVNEEWAIRVHSDPYVRKFTELSINFLALEKSIHLKSIWAVLEQRATSAALTIKAEPNKHFLSDLIVACYPHQWLENLFPHITSKRSGEVFPPIDRVLSNKSLSSRIPAYLLALCALFKTADEAFQVLQNLPEH